MRWAPKMAYGGLQAGESGARTPFSVTGGR
ncbi:unannotated protein [freshwater metagenome]|uniref:Unannotated protein n=1 Tax=freshwater metagenome TaxID=449393 RepID=A0A6J6RWI0_9ZZZZ